MQIQKYTIKNPPALNSCSFIIEQDFLRHIKTGVIPNLDKYLISVSVSLLVIRNNTERY